MPSVVGSQGWIASQKKYRESERGRAMLKLRRRRYNAAHPGAAAAACRKWAEANPDYARKRWAALPAEKKSSISNLWRGMSADALAAKQAKRRAAKLNATPPWSETNLIKVVYRKAKELGLAVDHVVPLRHKLVCGLHVHANLQLLDHNLNLEKGNRHWPDMP